MRTPHVTAKAKSVLEQADPEEATYIPVTVRGRVDRNLQRQFYAVLPRRFFNFECDWAPMGPDIDFNCGFPPVYAERARNPVARMYLNQLPVWVFWFAKHRLMLHPRVYRALEEADVTGLVQRKSDLERLSDDATVGHIFAP